MAEYAQADLGPSLGFTKPRRSIVHFRPIMSPAVFTDLAPEAVFSARHLPQVIAGGAGRVRGPSQESEVQGEFALLF
jgi:hypothetical protein